ncbi:unnamed protein product [Ascophyllum nodosum]
MMACERAWDSTAGCARGISLGSRAFTRFKVDKTSWTLWCTYLKRKDCAGGEATAGKPAPATIPESSCNCPNEFVYLGGNVNHDVYLFIEVGRRIRNACF